MPIIIAAEDEAAVANGRIIRLAGLPDFNSDDRNYKIFQFDPFFDTAAPDAVWVKNGGGGGAVASGDWVQNEVAGVMVGRIKGDKPSLVDLRRQLLKALPSSSAVPVQFLGSGWDVDLQMFLRRYDAADIKISEWLDFAIPLTALDPCKYALTPLTGQMGVYSGQTWYRTYEDQTTRWTRSYTLESGRWVRTYTQAVPMSAFPESLALVSGGDVTSRRVTVTIVGPLTAGDWWLDQETAGRRLLGTFGVTADQTLVIDSVSRTATLNGTDVSNLLLGDWPTLEPGDNTYRLVTGVQSGAHASLSALEAYE